MFGHHVQAAVRTAAVTLSFVFLFAVVAFAQPAPNNPKPNSPVPELRQNEPGKFDFYVLALSWSPSVCEASKERVQDAGPARGSDPQCGGRPYSFVVHGLWLQYEQGFPSFCQVPAPRIGRDIVGSMLDLMPSPRLIFHEWDRHGTCSGVSAHAVFETVRKARAVVKIPADYLTLDQPITVTPDQVAEAFVKTDAGYRAQQSRLPATTSGCAKCASAWARIFSSTIAPR